MVFMHMDIRHHHSLVLEWASSATLQAELHELTQVLQDLDIPLLEGDRFVLLVGLFLVCVCVFVCVKV